MRNVLRVFGILSCVVLAFCHKAEAQTTPPHDQSYSAIFHKGSFDVQVTNHADENKNLFILVNVLDRRAPVTSVMIRGANKNLRTCYPVGAPTSGLACQYTWARSTMPSNGLAEFVIRATLQNGVWYEVKGWWYRPDLVVAGPPPVPCYLLDGTGGKLTTGTGEPLTCL